MKKVLLSGFEPFGGEVINPSLELVKSLGNENWTGLEIHWTQLPVVFGEAVEKLKSAIDQINPDIVIGIGQAGGRSTLSFERVAINVDDAVIPDNEGNQPIDLPIRPDGPTAYFTTLPIKRVLKRVKDAGIPANISNTAGTYVCNHLMYGLLHLLTGTDKQGGFIHIPYLPEQVVNKPGQPSMSLELLVKGMKVAIQAMVDDITEDEPVTAGSLD